MAFPAWYHFSIIARLAQRQDWRWRTRLARHALHQTRHQVGPQQALHPGMHRPQTKPPCCQWPLPQARDLPGPCTRSWHHAARPHGVGSRSSCAAPALRLCVRDRQGDPGRATQAGARLEQPGVGVEAAGVQYGRLLVVEVRQLRLQAAVRVLRAADEAHAGQAEAVLVQRAVRGFAQAGVVGEPQVVVCACAAPRGTLDCCCSWGRQRSSTPTRRDLRVSNVYQHDPIQVTLLTQ